MKNISRRVFIKGLAVAGVAAAASTVLAGCNTNMIPGTDNEGEGEVVPTPSNTYTFKDGDNTLVVEAPKFISESYSASTANVENVVILMNLTNKLGDNLLYGAEQASGSDVTKGYGLVLSAEAVDKNGRAVAIASFASDVIGGVSTSGLVDLGLAAANVGTLKDKSSLEGAVAIAEITKDWAKITVTAKLYKANIDAQTSSNKYYYGSVIDKATFTFTND